MNKRTKTLDRVGYGRPPVHTQFKKGQSGNPTGRPKGRKNIGVMFNEIVYAKIKVREGDRVRSIPKIQAAFEVMINHALKGDLRSIAKLIDVARALGVLDLAREEELTFQSTSEKVTARELIARKIGDYYVASLSDTDRKL